MIPTRRSFLLAVGSPLIGSLALVRRHHAAAIRQLGAGDVALARNDLLSLVNAERMAAGESSLALDDLACLVADQHALDMAQGKFLSHWGRDGRKPYTRYGDAGGFYAVQENVAAAGKIESPTARYVGIVLTQMHTKMYGEVPPNDGHRRTILAPQHTNVGFGIALSERDLRLVELYVGKHIQLEPFPRQAKRKTTVQLRGKLLNPKYRLSYAEVFFEPQPAPPEIDWLREPRTYSLPNEYRTIRLVAPDRSVYADGVLGEIELASTGRFRIPVYLYQNKPGRYIVVICLIELNGSMEFRATNICIRVD
jgi:uncharacterized protein YkwD